jgi:hypothetical protein
MTPALRCSPMFPGARRRASVIVAALFWLCLVLPAGPAAATGPSAEPGQPLVLLMRAHVVRAHPDGGARRVETVPSRTPLTRVRTVLPVLGQAEGRKGGSWLRVRLPGRPNGHAGWISSRGTKQSVTGWQIALDLTSRRLTVYRNGAVRGPRPLGGSRRRPLRPGDQRPLERPPRIRGWAGSDRHSREELPLRCARVRGIPRLRATRHQGDHLDGEADRRRGPAGDPTLRARPPRIRGVDAAVR